MLGQTIVKLRVINDDSSFDRNFIKKYVHMSDILHIFRTLTISMYEYDGLNFA